MQLGPLAASTLVQQHRAVFDAIHETLKDSEWRPGALYIDGAAWKLQLHSSSRPTIEIEADIGDREMLILKLQAMV